MYTLVGRSMLFSTYFILGFGTRFESWFLALFNNNLVFIFLFLKASVHNELYILFSTFETFLNLLKKRSVWLKTMKLFRVLYIFIFLIIVSLTIFLKSVVYCWFWQDNCWTTDQFLFWEFSIFSAILFIWFNLSDSGSLWYWHCIHQRTFQVCYKPRNYTWGSKYCLSKGYISSSQVLM